MRSIRRTFRGPFVLPNTQRNLLVIFRARFTMICRTEIHMSVSRRRRRFLLRCTIHHVKDSEGNMLESAHASMTYGM